MRGKLLLAVVVAAIIWIRSLVVSGGWLAFFCGRGIVGPMRFRKLRIAFSATCLVACVLLIALWVRSFNTHKKQEIASVDITDSQSLAVLSEWGKVYFGAYNTQGFVQGPFELFHANDGSWSGDSTYFGHFYFGTTANSTKLIVPHYFLALLFGIAAIVTGIRRPLQFSFRTLLIATTLVAVVLALIVWLR